MTSARGEGPKKYAEVPNREGMSPSNDLALLLCSFDAPDDELDGSRDGLTPTAEVSTSAKLKEPPVARLLRLLRTLAAADHERGIEAPRLLRVADYGIEDQKSSMASLQRDLRRLSDAGWRVENAAPPGEVARYVLHPNDLAERAGLTPGEQSALEAALEARAVPPVESDHAAPHPNMTTVRRALDAGCVIEMTYDGPLRRVHPIRLHNPPGRWLLRAKDEYDGVVKWFLVHKIEDPSLDDPGTAEPDVEDPEDSLNPQRWRVDPPVDARLRVASEHVVFVRQSLGLPVRTEEVGEVVTVVVLVTNHRAFMDWLVSMGTRVRLVGPEDLRRRFLGRLKAVARG